MNTKQLTALIKPLSVGIAWLGGSLAAITAILSALGFLVLRSHNELLGVTAFVPVPPDAWVVEGARFLYNSLLYFFGGCLGSGWVLLFVLLTICLLALLNHAGWLAKVKAKIRSPIIQIILIVISALGSLIALKFFLAAETPSHLLVKPQQYDTALVARSTEAGLYALRMQYVRLLAMLPLLSVWLRLLPHLLPSRSEQSEAEASQTKAPTATGSVWQALGMWGLWAVFLLLVLLLPMLYGKMIKPNEYFEVRLIRKLEDNAPPAESENLSHETPEYKGWLLYEGNGRIVLYKGASAAEPIQIFKYEHFAQIEILGYGNIFVAH